jgi:hypothetical protein
MPEKPSPGAVLQVEFLTGDNADIEAGSRFFLTYTGGAPSAGDLNTLASDISTDYGTHMAPLLASSESLHNVTITDLSSDSGAVGEWTGTVDGTRSGTNLIASGAFLVNHQIDRRYRGGRPRTYVRGGVMGDLASGHSNLWSDTFIAAALAGWEAWIAEILGTTGVGITLTNIVNVSWYKGNTVFTTPTGRARNIPVLRITPVVDVIVASTVATKVGSQRRRLDI